MRFDLLDLTVFTLVAVLMLCVYNCSRPCNCPKAIYTDPVTTFVMSQPDIAVDVTRYIADKRPNPNLKPKGWDKL